MSVKPILFNTDMVRAVLDGRKTVTRRAVKCTHKNAAGFNIVRNHVGEIVGVLEYDEDERSFDNYTVPPYKPGDVLWVRETWFKDVGRYMYRADYSDTEKFYINGQETTIRWRPSIHMPKEAARIFLRVKNVCVERLQEIDADGIRAEGLTSACVHVGDMEIAMQEFALLWDSTIKHADLDRYGWDANPWVWVIAFERCEKPEGEK